MQARRFSQLRTSRKLLATLTCLLAPLGAACGAVYPEVSTPVRQPPPGRDLEPPPPADVLYIVFERAEIPSKTRDGRRWDAVGGELPDPFAKLLVDGKPLILTPVQANTLKPTWPDQVRANYRLPQGKSVLVEVWDSNALTDHPICSRMVGNIHEQADLGGVEIRCDSGARVYLTVKRAQARHGLGLYYELKSHGVTVTRVLAESPAGRAGLKAGMSIVAVQGRPVATLDADEVRSLINANAPSGVTLSVRQGEGGVREVKLKEEAMYPLVSEDVPLD